MRVDERSNSWSLLAIKMKVRTVVGRGEKSLLKDTGSELHLGRKKKKEEFEGTRRD